MFRYNLCQESVTISREKFDSLKGLILLSYQVIRKRNPNGALYYLNPAPFP